MSDEEGTVLVKLKDFLENLLALRVTDPERARYAADAMNVFGEDYSNERPLRVAAVLAILFHLVLFVVSVPFLRSQVLVPERELLVLQQLALPSQPMGGGPPEPEVVPQRPEVVPDPQPILVPIPDPTPFEPEPLQREVVLETPQVLDEVAADLSLGEITAPPGRGRGVAGAGTGMSTGEGPAAGAGDGVYSLGSGVTHPVVITQTIPSYTDQAIRAKAQGVVLLQAIIRRDGSVTDFTVLRGLGFGLEEKAIEEIATNWRFRPGTLDGRPVDVLATIEVTFNLR